MLGNNFCLKGLMVDKNFNSGYEAKRMMSVSLPFFIFVMASRVPNRKLGLLFYGIKSKQCGKQPEG
jgi:hypothetical protein